MVSEREGTTIWQAATELLACLKAREIHEQLAHINRSLVPGVNPRFTDNKALTRYPRLALESLNTAIWIWEQENSYGGPLPVLDALLVPHQEASLYDEINGLEQSIQRIHSASLVINEIGRLETFLCQRALEQPRCDVLTGRSIQTWLNKLVAGFKGLPSLFRLEIDRRQCTALHRTILEGLEDYEQRRSNGEPLPSPPS